jgi:hypothetical protein
LPARGIQTHPRKGKRRASFRIGGQFFSHPFLPISIGFSYGFAISRIAFLQSMD